MIRTMALVPIRGRSAGKTRLAPLFNELERATVVEAMAWHVVSTVRDAGVVDEIAIVSRDRAFRFAMHREPQAIHYIVQPDHEPGLNAALDFGRRWALQHGADRLLVLSADLPLLETEDVHELADRRAPVVIAPDRFATGTNGIMLGDPRRSARNVATEFSFRFGIGSFRDHLAEAKRLDVPVDTASGPGTSFDLDTPEDWTRLPLHIQQRLLEQPRTKPEEEHSTTPTPLVHHGAWAESG